MPINYYQSYLHQKYFYLTYLFTYIIFGISHSHSHFVSLRFYLSLHPFKTVSFLVEIISCPQQRHAKEVQLTSSRTRTKYSTNSTINVTYITSLLNPNSFYRNIFSCCWNMCKNYHHFLHLYHSLSLYCEIF